jgi:CRISPR/Cas system CSM-associated protein Csm3 (group 7 of RAMP superfamily)
MPHPTRMNRNHRHIVRRIIVKGDLSLTTPTCLSSGETEGLTDMLLLRDSISNHALLTGASIAGALRNYLREYQNGYRCSESETDLATQLFGSIRSNDDGDQSPLIVCDAISNYPPDIELRDGVCIDSKTGTAKPKAKYDLELLAADTLFPLQFELLIDESFCKDDPNYVDNLLQALAIALQGLEQEQIHIGMKKRRGFGHCYVKEWKVWDFKMKEAEDRTEWLTFGRSWADSYKKEPQQGKIFEALKIQCNQRDRRDRLTIHAEFQLEGSLLIRSSQVERDETGQICKAPDAVHLKSKRGGCSKPILSGTSVAGVLRHRTERIVRTLDGDTKFVDEIFGIVDESTKKAQSSRLLVQETEIENTDDLVQNRIAIDRFTGGAYHGALFDEQPIFGGESSTVTLSLELRQPNDSEIGLLLLLLKDLWTSDLAVGGGSSIGRGRLHGKQATITHQTATHPKIWKITQNGQELEVDDPKALERFVKVFADEITRSQTI